MDNLSNIAKLIGEDNKKRLKDSITDMLIDHLEEDLSNMSIYLIDFESMMDEIRGDIEDRVREKIIVNYTKKIEDKLDKYLKENYD